MIYSNWLDCSCQFWKAMSNTRIRKFYKNVLIVKCLKFGKHRVPESRIKGFVKMKTPSVCTIDLPGSSWTPFIDKSSFLCNKQLLLHLIVISAFLLMIRCPSVAPGRKIPFLMSASYKVSFSLRKTTFLSASPFKFGSVQSALHTRLSGDAGRKQWDLQIKSPNGFTITFWLYCYFAFLYSTRTASSLHNPSFIALAWGTLENNFVSHHGVTQSASQVKCFL